MLARWIKISRTGRFVKHLLNRSLMIFI